MILRRRIVSRIYEARPVDYPNGESAKKVRKNNSDEPRCQETLLRLCGVVSRLCRGHDSAKYL